MYEYLSQDELCRLRSHKYKSSGESITDRFMQKFWRPTVNHVPLWVAPNLLTLSGLMFNIFSTLTLILYSPLATSDVPAWTLYLSAFCLFAYQTLDAIDGKQARRTNSSSPLGELFDHGCDAISVVLCCVGLIITLKLGDDPFVAFLLVFSGLSVFYIYHWFVYVKDDLVCGKFDVTESQLVLIAIYLTSAFFGQDFWTNVYFGVSLRIYLFILIFFISGQTTLFKVSLILQGGVGRNGSTVAETSVISPGIPLISSLLLSYMVMSYYGGFIRRNPLFLVVLSISPVKQSTDIILRRMTRSPLILFDSSLLTYLVLLMFWFLSKIEMLSFILAAAYGLWDYLIYVFSVCKQISTFFGIFILSIKTQ